MNCYIYNTYCLLLGYSLLWVFLFGMVILSIYALISFAYFREIFRENGHFCNTLYECAISVLHRGLVDGIFNVGLTFK